MCSKHGIQGHPAALEHYAMYPLGLPPATFVLRTSSLLCRLGNINWLWYTWGATMINQYRGSDVQLYGGQGVLEYYSLEGASEWAFLGYAALTFVFFFAVTLIVRLSPPCLFAVSGCLLH